MTDKMELFEMKYGHLVKEVLAEARAQGKNLYRLSRELGVPYTTLRRWAAQIKERE